MAAREPAGAHDPRRRSTRSSREADVVDRIRGELDARIEQLRPLVGEFARLERAAAALARAGACALPGVGARAPAPLATKPGRKPAGRSTRAKPAGRRPTSQATEPTPDVCRERLLKEDIPFDPVRGTASRSHYVSWDVLVERDAAEG